MCKGMRYLILTLVGIALTVGVGQASTHEFFRAKVIRIVVGFGTGGGFDIYARLVARHMGKHLPGNPTVIVDNMPGAAGLVAANHLYKVAKSDGLTIGNFTGGLMMGQVLGRPGIEFDAQKFEYVGVPLTDAQVCILANRSGITGMEKWMASRAPMRLGGLGPGTAPSDVPKILKIALDLPMRLVEGYKSVADVRLAIDSGEIDGICGTSLQAAQTVWIKGIESGELAIVLQMVPQAHPEIPKVPLAIDFAKTDEGRQLIQVGIHDMARTNRLYVLPPGTPKDRVGIMRRAFMDTLKDPEFRADAKKSKQDVDPVAGEEVERTVARFFNLSPALVAKLKEVLK
ncbi:MAG: hypothetical protein HYV04_13085 [Deltaproteobacteria bacterium]|nr:hypothetical protein [Deltaproteobacteria bacterium]